MRLDAKRHQLDRRVSDLLRERQIWETRWKDIRDNILPTHGWFDGDIKDGKRRMNTLANDTPTWSVSVMAAGMQSGLTSPNNQWFRLAPEDPELGESNKVLDYLSKCEEIMQSYMSKSGIYDAFYSAYEELGAFGIGGFLLLEDTKRGFLPVPLTIGEYAIGVDAQRAPCEFYRKLQMTPAQMVEQFGKDKVSPETLADFNNNHNNVRYVHHLIARNDGRIDGNKGLKGKAYLSWYWEDGADRGEEFLSIGGYEEFPAIISRWTVTGPNVYGFGLGEMALGDAAQLQKIELDKLTALQLSLRPPLSAPASMRGRISLLPAAQNWYDSTTGDQGIKPILQVTPNLQDTAYEIARIEERIKRAFYVNMFLSLLTDPNREQRDRTATEINELHNEKLLMIGPVLQRLDREMLRPCIDRAFAILERQGLLPEPPQEIIGREIRVEYLSPLILAQRMAAIGAVDRYMGFLSNMSAVDPQILDNIDMDKTAVRYASDLGVPAELMREEEAIAQIRQGRAQRQQEMQQREQAMAEAQVVPGAAKALSEAEPTPNNLLGQIAGAMAEGGVQQ